jgi:crotonobetainyl-CoA:carnitine CoA-transferase CaiB-like acyl-CoA transferase
LGLDPRVTLGEGERSVDLIRNPIGLSGASVRYDRPPPTLGEHSDELREWLATTPS